MRNMNVSNEITKYIKGRANELVTVDEVATALGLELAQVRYGMRRLIEKTALGNYIQVVTRGNSWNVGNIPGSRKTKAEYNPSIKEWAEAKAQAAREPSLPGWEQVGTTADGKPVLRDEAGKLYKVIDLV